MLLIILSVTSLSLFQFEFHFYEEEPLNGVFSTSSFQPFTVKSYLDESFQKSYDIYFNDSLGFKGFFVRVNNQVKYSLFSKTNAKDVVIGKDNYLFEGGYIREFLGLNFTGKEKIQKKVNQIKQIQNELSHQNVIFLPVFAPGKATYFSEYIPHKENEKKKDSTNYNTYIDLFKSDNVKYLDFNSIFLNIKSKVKYPLYPKGGIHWTDYGVSIALDSLKEFLESNSGIKLGKIHYEGFEAPEKPINPDDDIALSMNLLFEYDHFQMYYPKYSFEIKNQPKPKLLVIGDSYGFNILNSEATKNLFSKVELWYYFKTIHPARESKIREVKELNIKQEIKEFDVVLLLSTESNIYKYGFGFLDEYLKSNDKNEEAELVKQIEKIKENKEWYNNVKNQAEERGISVDSMLVRSAKYWLKTH